MAELVPAQGQGRSRQKRLDHAPADHNGSDNGTPGRRDYSCTPPKEGETVSLKRV
jgi:hypothetical protein